MIFSAVDGFERGQGFKGSSEFLTPSCLHNDDPPPVAAQPGEENFSGKAKMLSEPRWKRGEFIFAPKNSSSEESHACGVAKLQDAVLLVLFLPPRKVHGQAGRYYRSILSRITQAKRLKAPYTMNSGSTPYP